MITSIYTADVKLNKKQNSYLKSLLIVNENGLIILDNRLFNVYFDSVEKASDMGVEIINKKHITDTTL